MHTMFITGASSGFGLHLTRQALAAGHRVVATDVDGDRLDASLDPTPSLLRRQLDVRDATQIRTVVAEANAWSTVDVLVNNAGFASFAPLEEADIDTARDMFDVNVLGLARVSQALLPTLRGNAGTVVQISSVSGRVVMPGSGLYAATKYAVEAISEAVFQETCTFGVRVRVIQPGSFDTRFVETAVSKSPVTTEASPYAKLTPVWDGARNRTLEPPQDPALVASAILAALQRPEAFLRVPVGADAVRMLALRDAVLPDEWSRLAASRVGFQGALSDDTKATAQRLGTQPGAADS